MSQCVNYREVGADGIDEVRPLWERLRGYHAALPDWPFAGEVAATPFERRRQELLAKAAGGALRVEIATPTSGYAAAVAYCVATLTAAGRGEVDSMFVDSEWRGRGVGTELLRRALHWLEGRGAITTSVAVAHANSAAASFYSRFGFAPRTLMLELRPEPPAVKSSG
jgi:diamine N-acetyltransferase